MAFKGYRVARIETMPNGAQGTFPVSRWMLRDEAMAYGRQAEARRTRDNIRFVLQSKRGAIWGIPSLTP